MAGGASEPHDVSRSDTRRRSVRLGALAVVIAGVAVVIWRAAHDNTGVRREAPEVAVVALTPPPPPPPPPPPKERPPEPEKTLETATPTPKPEAPQKPADAAPKQLTTSGPVEASNSYGVHSGDGGGLSVGGDPNGSDTPGGGFAAGAYSRYLTNVLQQAAQADDRVSHDIFAAQVQVWIAPDGRITKVQLARSSGDGRTDDALLAVLRSIGRLDEPPPAQLKFPARIALRGRRA